MVDFIKQKYKIRQCRNYQGRTRPCLNYHIKRCLAPCMGYVTPEEYKKQIDEIIDLLEGKTDKILKELKYSPLDRLKTLENVLNAKISTHIFEQPLIQKKINLR